MEEINELSFVAIDFETATTDRMACQVGLTLVEHGEIQDTIVRLIQPPGNRYDHTCVTVHGISEKDTVDAPTFDVVWKEIRPILKGKKLVSHNAKFDEDVLWKNCRYYDIRDVFFVGEFGDTMKIIGRPVSLDALCAGYGLSCDGHHDAGWDAKMCASVVLKYLSGEDPDETVITTYEQKKKAPHERLCGDVLQKDLTGADPNNPFYDKKVVITGEFDIDRKELAAKLKCMGADIDTAISKKTNIVLVGVEPGPSKMKKLSALQESGYDIKAINEIELMKMLSWKPKPEPELDLFKGFD